MVRRLFLTPPTLPETTITRCLTIPASQEWLGIFNAALLIAAQAHNYEQVNDTDLTAKVTADRVFEIYVAYLGECDPNMTCNEIAACLLPLVRPTGATYRVEDGVAQMSYDGGTTWTDVPLTVAGGVWTPLQPTPGADDDARACLAARRAAIAISELYRQTAGAVAADLLNTLNAINNFLYEVNLTLAEWAFDLNLGILQASEFGSLDLPTDFAAPGLDGDVIDQLACFLAEAATVSAGVVTFNWTTVFDRVLDEITLNPAVAIGGLLSYMGGPGLNRAGQVLNTDTPDCECAPDYTCVDTGSYPTYLFTRSSAAYPGSSYSSPSWFGNNPNTTCGQLAAIYPAPATRQRITFPFPVCIGAVAASAQINAGDHMSQLRLHFSDGTFVDLNSFTGGACKSTGTVSFTMRSTDWIELEPRGSGTQMYFRDLRIDTWGGQAWQ